MNAKHDTGVSRGLLYQLAAGLVFIVAYVATKRVNGQFQISPDASAWDPSAGMCLALLLVLGPWHTVTVMIAIITVDLMYARGYHAGAGLSVAMLTHAGVASLAFLLGERFLNKFMRLNHSLGSQRAVASIVTTSMLVPIPAAVYATVLQMQLGRVGVSREFATGFDHWVVESIGLLTVVPAILLLTSRRSVSVTGLVVRRSILEMVLQSAALAGAVWCMFFWPMGGAMQAYYLAVPPLIWILLRCGLAGGVASMMAVNLASTVLAWTINLNEAGLIGLQVFLLIITSSTLLVGSLAESIRDAQFHTAVNEDRYRMLFESNPQPMWVTDQTMRRFVAVNDAALHQYGYTREQFLAMNVSDLEMESGAKPSTGTTTLFGASALGGSTAGDAVSLAGGAMAKLRSVTTRHRRADGEALDVQLISSRMSLAGASSRLTVARDITQATQATAARERAEDALRLALLRLVSLVESSPLALIEWDSGFHVLRWSGRAPEIFGWPAVDVIGKTPMDWPFVFEEDIPEVRGVIASLLAGISYVTLKNRNYTKGGRVIWCRWYNTVLRDDSGRIRSVLSLVSDITEHEAAQANAIEWSNRYEAAAIASRQLLYELVPDTGEILWGADTVPVFGVPTERLSSLHEWTSLIHPDDRSGYDAAKRHVEERRGTFQVEYRVRRGDGTYIYIADNAHFYSDAQGNVRRMVGFVSDISGAAAAREELRKRAKDLARSNADLERFAAVASHDLREPLRMVTSFTRMLADRYRGKLDSDADEMIGFAIDGAERMQKMIEDLLTYARVGAPVTGVQEIDASGSATLAVENLRLAAEEAGATVLIKPLPRVLAEPTRLTLLFQNIISNAIKFRDPRNPPRIVVSANRCGARWRFDITDNGIGIDEQHNQRIFDMFQRLNPRAQYPGNGIGLSICRRIVNDLGGELTVLSSLGKGSTFSFTVAAAT